MSVCNVYTYCTMYVYCVLMDEVKERYWYRESRDLISDRKRKYKTKDSIIYICVNYVLSILLATNWI